MKKTICLILSHNTPELTENIFNTLNPYKKDIYDIFSLENGSTIYSSNVPRIEISRNLYFGGGLNYAFALLLKYKDKYDSLLFLNSDLLIHGMNFVSSLKEEMIKNNLKVISPAIINAEFNQCHWKQMLNWNSSTVRKVKWIDFQCPMFHIDYVEKQRKFPEELNLGWGCDILSGIDCERWGFEIGVSDRCTIAHLNNQTVKKNTNSTDTIVRNYNVYAEKNMFSYINKDEYLKKKFLEFRTWGENYNNA